VNGKIKGKIGVLVNPRSTLNQAAREVFSQIDLSTSIRRTPLTPNLFQKQYEYAAPTDLKGFSLINIQPQTGRSQKEYSLCGADDFYVRRDPNTVAVDNHDAIKKLLINSDQPSNLTVTVSTLDSTTAGGGTWTGVGDGTNLRADSDNYVNENGSLRWDIGPGGTTTAGIQNSTLNVFDATNFFGGNGSLFVWHWITSITNITNYILNIGSSASNYYAKTITTQNNGTAFVNGWNLLRFDLTSLTTAGTPVLASFNFISLYMTKTTGKINETDYRFDSIILRKGEPNNLTYYSKYPWQDISGVYKENSTADSDLLNCDMDEYNLVLLKATEYAGEETDEETQGIRVYRGQVFFNARFEKFKQLQKAYEHDHPSESMNYITMVARFQKL